MMPHSEPSSLAALALEHLPSSVLVIGRDLRVATANSHFLSRARRTSATTCGRRLAEVFPRGLVEQLQLERKLRELFLRGAAPESGKLTYRVSGLPLRTYRLRLVPIGAPPPSYVLLLLEDISEQEQLSAEVRRVEQRLASVVECADDLVVSLDPGGRVVTWNRAAAQISGLAAQQAKGRTLVELCAPEDRDLIDALLIRCGETHTQAPGAQPIRRAEAALSTVAGREVPVAWSCAPMRDETDALVGVVAVGRDLTEQRALEAQLIQSATMHSLGIMAGGIAHELRNPLGIISACAELLSDAADKPTLLAECSGKISRATRRAAQIIEHLLNFARPEPNTIVPVDLREAVSEPLRFFASRLKEQNIAVTNQLPSDLPAARGNDLLLQQVFSNLLDNACNAMPSGGRITLRGWAELEAGQVAVAVEDTGHGILPEHLPRIFDPFFTTMPVGKGTGLGLSLCYSIVRQHGGSIAAQSGNGSGSSFTLRLPLAVSREV